MGTDLPKTKLQTAREKRGWSQGEVAGFLGVDAASVSRWESRQRTPSGPARKLIASLLNVPLSEIESDFAMRSAA
jgi:transcriptional regulator with XRE-family HTH domain